MICLIAGAVLDLLEPALWVLAILANLTALQRIAFTWRATRDAALAAHGAPRRRRAAGARGRRRRIRDAAGPSSPSGAGRRRRGLPAGRRRAARPRARPPTTAQAQPDRRLRRASSWPTRSPARGDLTGARAAALAVAERHPKSRLAPRALLARGDARLRARATTPGADRPDAPDRHVSRRARAAGRALPARPDRRGARPARGGGAAYRELRILAPGERLRRRRQRPDRRARPPGVRPVPALAGAAPRARRAAAPRRRARPGADEAERSLDEARRAHRGPRAPGRRRQRAAAPPLRRRRARARSCRSTARPPSAARAPARAGAALSCGPAIARGRSPRSTGRRATGTEAETAEALYLKARVLEDRARRRGGRRLSRRSPRATRPVRWRRAVAVAPRLARLRQAATRRAPSRAGRAWPRWAAPARTGTRRSTGRAARPGADRRRRRGGALRPDPRRGARSYYGMLARRAASAARRDGGLAAALRCRSSRARRSPRIRASRGWSCCDGSGSSEVAAAGAGGRRPARRRRPRAPLRARRRLRRGGALSHGAPHHAAPLPAAAATGDPALPRAFWEMLYPSAGATRCSAPRSDVGIDPFLVAAVVREESSYYPRAVSRAGARGLMQLMPATARPRWRRAGDSRRSRRQHRARHRVPGRPAARVRRPAPGARRLQRRTQPRAPVVAGAQERRHRGLRRADPVRRDAPLRQEGRALLGGVPSDLRHTLILPP